MSSFLQTDVYTSSRLPLAIQRAGESSSFSPISCTLIHGDAEGCPGGYAEFDTPNRRSDTLIKETAPGKDLQYTLRMVMVTIGLECLWYRSTGQMCAQWPLQYCRTHEATGRPIKISRRLAQNVPGKSDPKAPGIG